MARKPVPGNTAYAQWQQSVGIASPTFGPQTPVPKPYITPDPTRGPGSGVNPSDIDKGGGSAPRGPEVSAPGSGGGAVVPPPAFSASQMLENLLRNAIGVSGLGNWAADLYNRGASPTEIVQALRYGTDTSDAGRAARAAYLNEFPDMDKFLTEGIFAGESPELQYISYRNTVRDAASRYEINADLVDNKNIAKYIGNRTSAAELVDRMGTAATAVATTPVETYALLKDYYGVNNGDLISFYLNPDATEAMLQKRYTAARLGTEAVRQRFGITVTEAENLAERGISPDEANQAFGVAADRATFMSGRGEVMSREQVIGSVFNEQEDVLVAERVGASRRGRFEAGGSFISGESGVAGLGASGN